MERPSYNELITRQNDVYAMEIIEIFRDKPKTSSVMLNAVTNAFILGAGGYEGSFDAALILEYGGLEVLLKSLGLSSIDTNLSSEIPVEQFEEAVRAAVDFGASWDDLEAEIPEDSISDNDLLGSSFLGPITERFIIPMDGSERPPWLPQ